MKVRIVRASHEEDLLRAQSLPLPDDVTEDRGPAPGQEQLRAAHARGGAGGQNGDAEQKN